MKCLKGTSFEVTVLAMGVSVTLGHLLCWFMLEPTIGYLETKSKDLHVCQCVKSWTYKKNVSLDTQLPVLNCIGICDADSLCDAW